VEFGVSKNRECGRGLCIEDVRASVSGNGPADKGNPQTGSMTNGSILFLSRTWKGDILKAMQGHIAYPLVIF
jgi:hypothetical protein